MLQFTSTDTVLITADQVVYCRGEILEKPESIEDIKRFWKMYENCNPEVVNGVCVYSFKTGKLLCKNEISKVSFKNIPQGVINDLVNEKEFYRAAGGFIIEHPKIAKFTKLINGSLDAVMGFSGELVLQLINKVSEQ